MSCGVWRSRWRELEWLVFKGSSREIDVWMRECIDEVVKCVSMDDLGVVVVVVVVDSLLQRILDYMCIWSVYKEKTIIRGWCVMDVGWCWGNGGVWELQSSQQSPFQSSVRR